jgi:hypothetical protein
LHRENAYKNNALSRFKEAIEDSWIGIDKAPATDKNVTGA